jgi:hypothetical protein
MIPLVRKPSVGDKVRIDIDKGGRTVTRVAEITAIHPPKFNDGTPREIQESDEWIYVDLRWETGGAFYYKLPLRKGRWDRIEL